MADRTERLRATLKDLHQELAEAESLDADARALLEGALREILEALESPSGGLAAPGSVGERLRDAARRVESEHPAMGAVVERLLDTLASLGI